MDAQGHAFLWATVTDEVRCAAFARACEAGPQRRGESARHQTRAIRASSARPEPRPPERRYSAAREADRTPASTWTLKALGAASTSAAMQKFDVAIIGGGIVGLATGYQLSRRFRGTKIVILEKEAGLAAIRPVVTRA